ncbi:MAG: hypothetical protein D6757_09300 [Alphaproteobacteria bacterium]|nr:MAG: hypothetical protein D6757_09300 [Alphaproteobacteria bacterium]
MNSVPPLPAPVSSFDPARADAPAERSWWLSFTDLLAILLSFFVLAFAMGRPDPQAWSATRGAILEGFARKMPTPSAKRITDTTARDEAAVGADQAMERPESGNMPVRDGKRLAFSGEALVLQLIRSGLPSSYSMVRDDRLSVFLRTDELRQIAEARGALRRIGGLFADWPHFEEVSLLFPDVQGKTGPHPVAGIFGRLIDWRQRLTAAGWRDAGRWTVTPTASAGETTGGSWLRLTLARDPVRKGDEG